MNLSAKKYSDNRHINSIDIAFEIYGEPSSPTILLISGLSTPLTAWPTSLIEAFLSSGFRVVLLDNRDIGHSELLSELPMPNVLFAFLKLKLGFAIKVPYQLEDMMNDVVALMDVLNIDSAHIVGVSMGGMIAQLLAIHYPHRTDTLTSIMSMTGNKNLPPMDKKVKKTITSKPASNEYSDRRAYHIKKWQAIGSPKYPAQEAYLGEYVDKMLERGITAKGTLRQFLAIMAASNRESRLAKLTVPTLVIHGDSDPLINVAGGKATANAIPNAKLKIYPGMGHDLPIELIPEIAQDIIAHAATYKSEPK